MEDLRLNAVAARVVAWHNRHPLARRITAAQVHSIGYVALPYSVAGAVEPEFDAPAVPAAPAEGGSLRERALARARHQGDAALPVLDTAVVLPGPPKPGALKAAFNEDFIAPLSPRRVAAWARRHGRARAQAPADAPLREVLALPLPPGRKPLTLFVLTAAIEVGSARRRVLLGAGDQPAVLGRFLWSAPRSAGLAMGVAALALALRLGLPMAAPDVPSMAAAPAAPGVHAAAAASAAAEAPAASQPQVEVALATPAEPAEPPPQEGPQLHVAPLAPAASAASANEAAQDHPTEPMLSNPPLDVEPRLGRVTLPPLDLPHKDAAKSASRLAREQRAAALMAAASAPAPSGPASAPSAGPAVVAAAPTPASAAPPAVPRGAPAFAVSTRLLRTRAEADQLAAAMSVLLQGKDGSALRVDVLAQGDDWRVVGWPFAAAAQADKARALLAARGMRVAVVDF